MNLHIGRELTDQIIAALTAGGLTVGRAHKPDAVPADSGYVVVFPLTGGTTDGGIDDPFDDAVAPYQFTSIGTTAQQCEWVADKARVTIIAASLTLTDRTVIRVHPAFLGGVQRDDDVQPPLFYSPDRYDIRTTPA